MKNLFKLKLSNLDIQVLQTSKIYNINSGKSVDLEKLNFIVAKKYLNPWYKSRHPGITLNYIKKNIPGFYDWSYLENKFNIKQISHRGCGFLPCYGLYFNDTNLQYFENH